MSIHNSTDYLSPKSFTFVQKHWVSISLIVTGCVLAALGFAAGGLGLAGSVPEISSSLVNGIGQGEAVALMVMGGAGLLLVAVGSARAHSSKGKLQSAKFGWALQKPMVWWMGKVSDIKMAIDPHAFGLRRTAKIVSKVFFSFVAVVTFLPTLALYHMGSLFNRIIDAPRINEKNLHERPNPFVFPEGIEQVSLDPYLDWLEEFNPLGSEEDYGNYAEAKIRQSRFEQAIADMKGPISEITLEKDLVDGVTSEEYYPLLKKHFQYIYQILEETNDPSITAATVISLIDATRVCRPTWLEATSRILEDLLEKTNKEASQRETDKTKEKILTFVQRSKEDRILQFLTQYTSGQWHGLNVVRRLYGEEFGLKDTGVDGYADRTETGPVWNFLIRSIFSVYYTPSYIIPEIRSKINAQKYDSSIATEKIIPYLINQRGYSKSEAADYMEEHLYDEEFNITEQGVVILLKSIGHFA